MTRKRPASQRHSKGSARRAEGRTPPPGKLDGQDAMASEVTTARSDHDAAPNGAGSVVTDGLMTLGQEAPNVEPAGPAVLIEVDPDLSGGFVFGRFDVMVRGRVVSPATIVEVRLECSGMIVSVASYGQPERAAFADMPDGTQGRQRGFQFNLPCPAVDRPVRQVFQIVARTSDDLECTETFVAGVDHSAADPVVLVSGSSRQLTGVASIRPHALLYIERGTIDGDGLLSVHGWAVAMSPILAVQVYAGEERAGKALLGSEREDVATVYATYPNGRLSGFNLTVQLDDADRDAPTIRAQVVCSNGFGHEESVPVERLSRRSTPRFNPTPPAAARTDRAAAPGVDDHATENTAVESQAPIPAQEPTAEISLFCDEARLTNLGRLTVNGWTVCAAGVAQVRVLVDDAEVGLATYGHERPDVGASYAHIPMACFSGFKFDHGIGDQFEGEHTVEVIVRNMLGEEKAAQAAVIVTAVTEPAPAAAKAGSGSPTPPPAAAPAPEQSAEFKFELDAPATSNGVAVETVTGRLTIDGWLLCRSEVEKFEVFLDDQRLGDMHYGLARQDVGTAFPDWPNSLRSGYAFHCPPRSLRNGDHTVRLKVRAASGAETEKSFTITVNKSEEHQDQAGLRRRVPRIETDMMMALLDELNYRPSFRFVLRQDRDVSLDRLRTTLNAFRLQCYDDWTMLVLAEDDDVVAAMHAAIDDTLPHLADRFTIITPQDVRWTVSLADAMHERSHLIGLLLPGDEIGADMLLELAMAGGRDPSSGLIYGDEVRISPVSRENEPFFKPDYSPDLIYSTNYIGRPWVATAEVMAVSGATPARVWEAGEYDLVLRCIELAGAVRHVPKLLCQRASVALDDPAQERTALLGAMERLDIAGTVLETPIPGTWRIRRAVQSAGKVSIIIPTCAAHGYIETCIRTLREKTAYKDYEIVVIDNIPATEPKWKAWVHENADKVVNIPDAFNWSIFNNRAAAVSEGDYFLFLNDDIEIIQEDWLDALLENGQRPEVGITGPQLLYRDGKVQHAGMFLAHNGIGRHAFRFASKDDPCYFGLALTQRNVMAVTGACMLVRRDTFERLGGFEEAHQIVNNDLDFCLRVHRAGLLTVYTPYATLIHYELASRAYLKDVFDLTHFNAAWKTVFAAGDPYFNPRLWKHADDFRPDDEPVQWVVSGAPIFHKEEIQNILVVKLDHIGDFVTALPPIRRLKSIFPHARITVLAGRASRAFVSLEPSIDELITFDFFHARSQLGERELSRNDFVALAEQLRPYRFDLAVDLRKHPSTRDVLKYTGARFLAGFDHLGQYPNLDIALDWDGDRTLQRKRSHIVDDLLSLVNAIGRATEMDRVVMRPGPLAMPLDDLPDNVRALFDRPVVAIHPGAGNITKQWPEEHFSALIDLIIERNNVNVMLVGGPDEVEVADRLTENVLHTDRIASMAGKTPLADLPRLLKNCVLYIGNDSGPKHIAAAVGLPTIGVHSGVVDPVEWGPLGPSAVALRRNMTCSPCYLAKAEDCPRSLACLRYLEPSMVYETADLLLTRVQGVVLKDPAAAAPEEASQGDMAAAGAAATPEAA